MNLLRKLIAILRRIASEIDSVPAEAREIYMAHLAND